MKTEVKENYILINPTEDSFNEFFQKFEKEHSNFENNSLIINFSLLKNFDEENISLFLSYADMHLNNGTSFVLVCQNINIDKFPEVFNIVPTLLEGKDVIEMEDIQRDLGF